MAVVGGGPAGTATALRLAAAGRSVAVLERSHYDRPRVGETLAPWVQPPLRDLGVWDRFTALGSLPSWGTRSVWAVAGGRTSTPTWSAATGSGWHVDRRAFDRMLADAAVEAGAAVLTGWSVAGCAPDGGRLATDAPATAASYAPGCWWTPPDGGRGPAARWGHAGRRSTVWSR